MFVGLLNFFLYQPKIFCRYASLKEEILSAANHGEQLLGDMKKDSQPENAIGHIAAVERLLSFIFYIRKCKYCNFFSYDEIFILAH